MRTIKFRAWDKETQQIYPVTSFNNYRPEVENGMEYCGVVVKHENGYDKFLDDERAIPMQFTGLLDKNGKEIYEGDRVKFIAPTDFGDEDMGTYTVNWNTSISGFKPFDTYQSRYCEVIGNIYENPKLLN